MNNAAEVFFLVQVIKDQVVHEVNSSLTVDAEPTPTVDTHLPTYLKQEKHM